MFWQIYQKHLSFCHKILCSSTGSRTSIDIGPFLKFSLACFRFKIPRGIDDVLQSSLRFSKHSLRAQIDKTVEINIFLGVWYVCDSTLCKHIWELDLCPKYSWICYSQLLCNKKCQFGCEISKMVGPKKQDFCPRINMLKEKKNLPMNYTVFKNKLQ